jgi:hypothetical protein
MKTGKEIKTNHFKDYNVIFGSINNKNPKAIFINISSWAEPVNSDILDYTRTIKDINKKVKQSIFNFFYASNDSDFLIDRTIVDLDIRKSGIKFGKRSFANCEITIFLKEEIPLNTEYMKDNLLKISESVIRQSFQENKNFKFHRRKK